jgi:tripartite motif-containing protein 71
MSVGRSFSQVFAVSVAALALLGMAASAQGASGTWDRAWGKNVSGGGVFEICTVAATCQAGDQNGPGLGGEMFGPSGVALDSGGDLYVADSGHNRIQKFDSSGNFERTWGSGVDMTTGGDVCTAASGDTCQTGAQGGLRGELSQPAGVAVDSGGNVYVGDFGNNRIQRFSSTGVFERTWGKDVNMTTGGDLCTLASGNTCQAASASGLAGGMNQPIGIATDSSANVYVADSTNNRIQKFDSSGTFDRTWGKDVNASVPGNLCTAASGNTCQSGSATTALGGEMNTPAGVGTDPSGNVYVADALNNRIQKFNSSGGFDRAWGVNVNGAGVFGVCTSAASCLSGSSGGLGGEMFFPLSVIADSGGNVYVADYPNDRIQKFSSSGSWDRAWGKGVNGGTAFGVCTVAANCQAGSAGGLGAEMDSPEGLAVNSAGDLFVGDNGNNRIQKFVDPPAPPPAATPSPGPSPAPAAKKKCKKPKKRAAAAKKCKKRKK